MTLYLLRHTTPQIDSGICYGQTDLSLVPTATAEMNQVLLSLPAAPLPVYSSPLRRCTQLAEKIVALHPSPMKLDPLLMEMHFGEWEMKPWDAINAQALQNWMDDFVAVQVPGGESFEQLHRRTAQFLEKLPKTDDAIVVTHAGVIRSIASHINATPLIDAFTLYKPAYGSVIQLNW